MVLVHLLDPIGTLISHPINHLQLYNSETKQLRTPYYSNVAFCEDVFRIRRPVAFPPVIWCPQDPIQRYSWNLQPRRLWAKKTWLGLKLSVGHAAVLQTEHNLSWAKDSFIRFIYHRHIHIPIYTLIYTLYVMIFTSVQNEMQQHKQGFDWHDNSFEASQAC